MTNLPDYPPDTVYLPIKEPPEGWRTDYDVQGYVLRNGAKYMSAHRVLGHPVPALPDLSPEARAVLEAAARFGRGECDSTMLKHAACDYAATLTPPDPLAEAREALEEARLALAKAQIRDGRGITPALDRLAAALDRMKKDSA